MAGKLSKAAAIVGAAEANEIGFGDAYFLIATPY